MSENIDAENYDCDPELFKIPQYDGNDTLGIENAGTVSSNPSNTVRTRVAEFELNKAKQTASICKDALIKDFKVVTKDQERNINIECSSGFYAQVAKPTLCSLSQDHIPPILGISVFCEDVARNLDNLGHEYSRTMFFKLQVDDTIRKATVHVHHSSRLVQIQGGALMPDKSTAASWFVRNILHGKFQILAKAKSYSIASFNTAITSLGDAIMNTSKHSCGSCDIVFDSRSKPVYCLQCVRWYHKTNCYRGHRCRRRTYSDHTISNHTEASATQRTQEDVPLIPTVAIASITSPVAPTPTLSASSQPSTEAASSSVSSMPAIQNHELIQQPAGSILSSVSDSQRPPPLPRTVPPPLDPDAQQFHPRALPPPRNVKKTKVRQTESDFTPEKAEIESLKIELSYARTQIIDLETKNIDKDKTIKIYSQKLKIFEENRLNSLDEKYFTTTAPTSLPSDSSNASDCSCQIRSKISRNETNLKDLDLKITLELVDFKRRLDEIRNILGNAGSPTSDPSPAGRPNSSPEENPLLLPAPVRVTDPSSSNPSRPETRPNTRIEETEAERPDLISHSEEPISSLEMSTSSSDSDTGESEYEFSDVDYLN